MSYEEIGDSENGAPDGNTFRKDERSNLSMTNYYNSFHNKVVIAVIGCVLFLVAVIISPKTSQSVLGTLSMEGSEMPPNIIFILADDMGYGSLNEETSPFLVSLRDSGVSLEKYYAQEACTPSRASFLTGRYPLTLGWQMGMSTDADDGGLNLNETIIAEVLKNNGYTTYMLGKWNMGNRSPRYLPTARGFDHFLGFMNGYNNYWSKLDPDSSDYIDFMYADKDCYYQYDGGDLKMYSTNLYRDWAVQYINGHDFDKSSMFMYLAFQAVHSPWADNDQSFGEGIPRGLARQDAYAYVEENVNGAAQKQYQLALAIMDSAIGDIHKELNAKNQLDKTYFIFASDNGGCPSAGGRNYPLRGTKGSLFEGGFKVEAFIYGKNLPSTIQGTKYYGLFHVSDWFPTILGMADITNFEASDDFQLDGVDQFGAITGGDSHPRSYLLYNYYYQDENSDLYTVTPAAVRNSQYKLLHTYNSSTAGGWYTGDEVFDDDTNLETHGGCSQSQSESGEFTVSWILNILYEAKMLHCYNQMCGIYLFPLCLPGYTSM
jgi:arylsulfatase A-like enzyme